MQEENLEGQGKCNVGLCEGGPMVLEKEVINNLSLFKRNGKRGHERPLSVSLNINSSEPLTKA